MTKQSYLLFSSGILGLEKRLRLPRSLWSPVCLHHPGRLAMTYYHVALGQCQLLNNEGSKDDKFRGQKDFDNRRF